MPIHSRKVPLKSPLSPAKKLASEAKKRTSWRHDPLGSRKSYLEEAVFKDDEAEEPLFLWEDERTLVADLMHDNVDEESEDDKIMQLIESIQPSFSMHSKELLADIADNMVPAVKRVKQHHQLVENEIDRTYALGVATFEKGCKNDERALLDQHAAIEEAYRRCQANLKELLKQLRESCKESQHLWNDYSTALENNTGPLLLSLKGLPTRVERCITDQDKQSKQIGSKDKTSTEKMLRGLLGTLA